jgi:hypothetical protein
MWVMTSTRNPVITHNFFASGINDIQEMLYSVGKQGAGAFQNLADVLWLCYSRQSRLGGRVRLPWRFFVTLYSSTDLE